MTATYYGQLQWQGKHYRVTKKNHKYRVYDAANTYIASFEIYELGDAIDYAHRQEVKALAIN